MNTPYGGTLVDLIVDASRAAEMKAESRELASLTLDERSLCDLELLAVGGYSPLRGFLGRADHERVVAEGRLADGTPWPLPVTLSVPAIDGVAAGRTVALRDVYGNLLAFLHVDAIHEVDPAAEARALGEPNPTAASPFRASGRLEVLRTPPRYDFVDLRLTPRELRDRFAALGWSRIVAYQSRGPMRRRDEEIARRASERIGGGLLLQAIVGSPKPGDVDHYTRVRCLRAVFDNYLDQSLTVAGLLPYVERHAGPRETLLRGIVARNFGCTHLVVDRNAAPDPARAEEIGIAFVEADEGALADEISHDRARNEYLAKGVPLPGNYVRPEVAEILAETHRPRHKQGLTIWFTGLSGSGKSTVAHALVERLAEYGRNVSMLDGDEIRTHLSKGLGFSRADRDININRVGYVAGLVARHGGTTLCSVISPYRAGRDNARAASHGNFVEVYCDTPIDVCESRDVKGLYAKARDAVSEGKPMGFTGVDDPYEPPLNPEVTIDTGKLPVDRCAEIIIEKLLELGYILPHGHRGR